MFQGITGLQHKGIYVTAIGSNVLYSCQRPKMIEKLWWWEIWCGDDTPHTDSTRLCIIVTSELGQTDTSAAPMAGENVSTIGGGGKELNRGHCGGCGQNVR